MYGDTKSFRLHAHNSQNLSQSFSIFINVADPIANSAQLSCDLFCTYFSFVFTFLFSSLSTMPFLSVDYSPATPLSTPCLVEFLFDANIERNLDPLSKLFGVNSEQ